MSTCNIPLQASTNIILYNLLREAQNPNSPGTIWCTSIALLLEHNVLVFFVSTQTLRCFSWKLLSVLLSFTLSTAWFQHLLEPGLRVQNTVQELQSQGSERAQLVFAVQPGSGAPFVGLECAVRASSSAGPHPNPPRGPPRAR